MTNKNLSQIRTDHGLLTAATVDGVNDSFYIWDNSATNELRSKAITPNELKLWTNAGVDVRIGAVKPTTRSNGDALVAGDRWFDTSTSIEFFWSGSYWLTPPVSFELLGSGFSSSASISFGPTNNTTGNDFWIEKLVYALFVSAGALDSSNKWRLDLSYLNTAGTLTSVGTYDLPLSVGANSGEVVINTHFDVSALTIQSFWLRLTKIGAPPNISSFAAQYGVVVRYAKP